MYSTLLFDSPAGRLVLGDGGLVAEGEGWQPLVTLLELAERDPEVAGALLTMKDVARPELAVESDPQNAQLCVVTAGGRSVTLPRSAVREIWSRMRTHRRVAELLAWLAAFPVAEQPDPSQLDALEAQIAALDPADLVARKRLMLELHAQGLLDDRASEPKQKCLGPRPHLTAWFDAARRAAAYLRSPERRQRLGEPVPLLASGVSLEWFLRGPYSSGAMDPDAWLALQEARLLASEAFFDPTPHRSGSWQYSSDNGRTRCLVSAGDRVAEEPAVSRGTSPDERLLGAEFWIVGLGSALLLVIVYLWVRY